MPGFDSHTIQLVEGLVETLPAKNQNLDHWEGIMNHNEKGMRQKDPPVKLTNHNIIRRGSFLRDT